MKNTRDHISLTGWRLKEQTPANFIIYFISMKIKKTNTILSVHTDKNLDIQNSRNLMLRFQKLML